jgi:beta-lactamase class A
MATRLPLIATTGSALLDKQPSYRRKSASPGSSSPGGVTHRGGRASARPDQRAGPREPTGRQNGRLRGTRQANPRQQATKRFSRPLRLAQLLSYTLLLILTARVVSTAWDSVQVRRAELAGEQGVDVLSPQQPFVVGGGQERRMDAALASAVGKVIDSSNGTTAVYIKKLNSGVSAAIDEDGIFPTASLFKIPILVELLRQQGLGMVDMNTKIVLQQKYWAEGSGVLQAQIGKSFTVQQLVDYMIGVSDNTAALALLDLVGTDNVNLTLQANGLEETRLRIGWPTKNWGGQEGENTTTAREMGTLLEKIATGTMLGQKGSEDAVRILSQKQQVAWLPVQLPPGTRVAHKTGELEGVRHDAGVVYAPHGAFVVVVLTEDITDYDKVADTITRVARAAYDYFETGKR